ncbi:TetR/AcrR family transcriptional regulator [Oxalicibacterium solurbis]|uniref:TetR family transcriptional regulator n=1 Tax=Oxalicibacterium solurbis TaxID=69280 RepID=A0A8J3AWX8_9BURK|nr:TetR/AcrR family transcriptional regulator [Oxalicibacterium solurbis]GGI54725.1 TetR family transcriptional regulator [Oxalicibacterium solurbis]
MPRVSKEQTERNRHAIEDASASLFKGKGFSGVSVADLMSAAGLTHGGFYGHFSSKDELAAVACDHAFSQSAERWEKRIADSPDEKAALRSIVDHYLSQKTLHDAGNGCPGAALAVDVAREPDDKPVHAAYRAGTAELVEILATLAPGDTDQRRATALTQWCTMVGAAVLARATRGDPMADELLAAARDHLLSDR